MKINHLKPWLSAITGLVLLSTAGCYPNDKKTEDRLPVVTNASASASSALAPGVTSTSWTEIKDATFEQRTQLFASLATLESAADAQVSELTVQRVSMPANARTQEWDAAMKEMNDARAHLRGMVEEIKTAQADAWQERKDQIGLSWTRTQNAYAKVKASVTQ